MSGIVGSKFNHRGSGLVGSLGTDGQHFLSSGAGKTNVFETVAAAGGAWNLLSTFTSDGSDATASFTSGIDSTYKEYCFRFINIHPETDDASLKFNGSIDGGSNYNIAKTSILFDAYNREDGGVSPAMAYRTAEDLSQGTGTQTVIRNLGNDADAGASGFLFLVDPASTTYVKQFYSTMSEASSGTYHVGSQMSGYLNTTSAINAIQFSMSSGEIQGGVIKLYGIS